MQTSNTTKQIAIRAMNNELARWVRKLETGFFFDCASAVEKRDAVYLAIVELGGDPAFLRERCRNLSAKFPFIPDLPKVGAGDAA